MSFRFRIAAWVVVSCTLLIGVMMFTAHTELEEELRAGRVDRHSSACSRLGASQQLLRSRKSRTSSAN